MRISLFLFILLSFSQGYGKNLCQKLFVLQKEERVYHWIKPFVDTFETTTRAEDAARLTRKNELRYQLFKLFAASKILSETEFNEKFDTEALEKLQSKLKKLENHYEEYALARDISKFAEKNQFPPAFVINLKQQKWEAFKEYQKYLSSKKWYGPRSEKIKELKELVKETDWPSYKKTEIHILRSLIEYLDVVQDEIEPDVRDHIYIKKYTYADLENGLHEWRRGLRRVILFILAFDDIFKVNNSKLPPSLQKYHANEKFKLDDMGYGKIEIPGEIFYQLVETMLVAGDIKDIGEAKHYLAEALVEYGQLSNKKVDDYEHALELVDARLGHPALEKQSQELWKKHKQQNSLKKLQTVLQKQLDKLED